MVSIYGGSSGGPSAPLPAINSLAWQDTPLLENTTKVTQPASDGAWMPAYSITLDTSGLFAVDVRCRVNMSGDAEPIQVRFLDAETGSETYRSPTGGPRTTVTKAYDIAKVTGNITLDVEIRTTESLHASGTTVELDWLRIFSHRKVSEVQ